MKFFASGLGWLGVFVVGSLVGLGLRLACFATAAAGLAALSAAAARLTGFLPFLDPVYTRAAENTIGLVQIQGLAVLPPLGDYLHAALPQVFADAARAHWSFVRFVVEPGSPVLGRLLAAGLAHAVVLTAGLLLVRDGWHRRSSLRVVLGIAMQIQIAIGILGAQPSIRELEATGLSFAANALLPSLAPRSAALSDAPFQLWPPLVASCLVGLSLLVGYLPIGLVLLLRDRTRLFTIGTAALVMLGSAACAGVLREDSVAPVAAASVPVHVAAQAPIAPQVASSVLPRVATTAPAFDTWFSDSLPNVAVSPSHVEVVGTNFRYQYLVNGEPQVIKGMGLNTQYASQLSPSDRAARIEDDMAEMEAMGVNTVLGWDPAEFDEVLLDAAERHGIGVIMPFDLDPAADYTDPTVRQQLHDQALAWVARYRNHPAVRMWGLGNEVLHKIVHPAWVGPQDPANERQAEAFSDWLVWTADDIHAMDPDHPVTYRSAEDAFVDWVIAALNRAGGGPRPWFVWGTNCYQPYLSDIVDHWTQLGMPTALWVSEFAPGGIAIPDRPDGFATMWGYVRRHPEWTLGGAVYAWTRNGPEGVDRNFGLTDDGVPVDGRSLDMLTELFHSD